MRFFSPLPSSNSFGMLSCVKPRHKRLYLHSCFVPADDERWDMKSALVWRDRHGRKEQDAALTYLSCPQSHEATHYVRRKLCYIGPCRAVLGEKVNRNQSYRHVHEQTANLSKIFEAYIFRVLVQEVIHNYHAELLKWIVIFGL